MPNYSYKAMTDNGSITSGVLEAESREHAQSLLADRGLIPQKVSETSRSGDRPSLFQRMAKVKPRDIILFTKQLRTLLSAGVSVTQALEVLETQTENIRLKNAIIEIGRDIRGGTSMSKAFTRHSDIFSELYCNMIHAGEVSGTLIEVLERLIYLVEHEYKVKKDIKGALTYPIIVIVALIIAFVVLVVFVLPVFVDLFMDAGIALPLPTRVCIALNTLMVDYWYLLLTGAVGGFVGLSFWLKTERGKYLRDAFVLRLPIFGSLVQKGAMARFGSIFAILQASGVTVLDTMSVIADTIGNKAIAREFIGLKEKLEEGRGLSGPLSKAHYFTPMIVSMVAIGEESGQLEEMMREAAEHYDYEVEYTVSKLSELIGPILTAGLACVIGFFALSIFLPLIELMNNAMSGF